MTYAKEKPPYCVGSARVGVTVEPNGLLDTGFFRTGVRPQSEDSGLGGLDDFGNPFSSAVAQNPNALAAVIGAFKTPTLRNVEFTGPYFHNGSQATLEQVIDFYLRGSDFPNGNLGPDIQRRNTSPADRQSLASFLRALTDDRVRYERARFDHPELCVPMGELETDPGVLQLGSDEDGRGRSLRLRPYINATKR